MKYPYYLLFFLFIACKKDNLNISILMDLLWEALFPSHMRVQMK